MKLSIRKDIGKKFSKHETTASTKARPLLTLEICLWVKLSSSRDTVGTLSSLQPWFCGISVQGPCSVPSFKLVLKVVLVEVTLVSVVSALVLEIEVRAAVTAVVVTDAVGVSVSATVSVIVSVGDVDV